MGSKHVIAENLGRLVEKSGIGKNALADIAGVSRSQFYDVLAAKKAATIDWLERVATALDVEVSDLMRPRR